MSAVIDMFPEAKVNPMVDLDRRYTTRETLDLCRKLAGVEAFDLDVAADEESHHADNYFTIQMDGLKQRWFGRVWCNPPYSDIEPWVQRAWLSHERGDTSVIAMLLPCNRTEQAWWQELIEPVRDGRDLPGHGMETHFLPGRIKFGHPGNRDAVGVGSPPFGCVLLVWRQTRGAP